MADEGEVVLAPENAEVSAPATETQEGAEASNPFDGDPDLKGKSPEEIVRMYRDQKSFIGKQSETVGQVKDLHSRLGNLEAWIQQAVSQVRPTERQEQEGPKPDPITNPDEWFKAKYQELATKDRQVRDRAEQARLQGELVSRWNKGKNSFFNDGRNRTLFEGIETETEQAMSQFLRNGTVKLHDLDDRDTWVNAAKSVRFARGEYDRLVQKPGMGAPDIEKPGSRRQSESEITLDDEVRRIARSMGSEFGVGDEKGMMEAMKYGIRGAENGEILPRGVK